MSSSTIYIGLGLEVTCVIITMHRNNGMVKMIPNFAQGEVANTKGEQIQIQGARGSNVPFNRGLSHVYHIMCKYEILSDFY